MKEVSKKEQLSYGLGGIGASAYQVLVMAYMTYFYTDVFGLSGAVVGTLMLVTRFWDGINDPIMGVLVDRTQSRWGRFRPYLLFVPPFLALSFVLLFTTPNFGPTGKIVYAYVTYIIYVSLYTLYDIPSNALAPAMSHDREERKGLIATLRTMTGLAALVAVAALPAVGALGGGHEAKGFQYYAIVIGVVCIAVSWIAFKNTKERVKVNQERITIKEYVHVLKNSKVFMVFLLFIIVSGIGANVQSGLNIHYMKHYIQRMDLVPLMTLIGLLTYMISASMAAWLSKRVSTKRLLVITGIVTIILVTVRYFFAKQSLLILFAVTVAGGLMGGLAVVFVFMASNDIIDYIEWKHGRRSESMVFSLLVFTQKLSMALGGALVGFTLAYINYKSGDVVQTAQTVEGINLGMAALPIVLSVISIVIISLYPLSESKLKTIEKALKEKNEVEPTAS